MTIEFNTDSSRADGARDAYFAAADVALDQLLAIVNDPSSSPDAVANARAEINNIRNEMGAVGRMGSGLSIDMRTSMLNDRLDEILDSTVSDAVDHSAGWVGRAFSESFDRAGIGGGGRPNIGDGASLYEKMSNDPRGFASFWKDLSPEDRQLAMFTLQTYVQDQNQLTTMMTNMLSAAHQTSSAIARNLSV